MTRVHPYRESAEKRVGQWLSKWHLDRLIDVGGMAAVYEGTHRNGNKVALKVLHRIYSSHPEARGRFLREGYLANKVGHPRSVTVLDDGELEDGTVFLVMELLHGESLEARIQSRGTLSAPECLFIADQALDVLSAAHQAGIVHRDIKPPNLFLTESGEVKVLDFGLARVRERSFDASMTRTGMVIGTASYMPPEQARGKRDLVEARTDLWALGATLFKALTGSYVHDAGSVNERLVAAMSKRAPAVQSLAPGVPDQVAEIVDRALEYQISDRYDDAGQMQAAVRVAYRALTNEDMPTPYSAPRIAGWTQPGGASVAADNSVDIHVSVVIDAEPSNEHIQVEFEGEDGRSERVRLRRRSEAPQPPGGVTDDDEISEVSVVEYIGFDDKPKPKP